ncbi:hypothetical protein LCGC14_0371710 [marine sediment metagenome]|uniref:Uncharacterized protein n=1 Tax=marine sediment metagenome TaxID=412755 RepID=A0A0F9TAZ0_9ZZZZ
MSYEDQMDAKSDYDAERRGEGIEEGIAEERERILNLLHDSMPYSKFKHIKELIEK